jgi:hypothetical protein
MWTVRFSFSSWAVDRILQSGLSLNLKNIETLESHSSCTAFAAHFPPLSTTFRAFEAR